MTETTDHPPTPVMTRLGMMAYGAAFVMTVLLGTGLGIAIGKSSDPVALNLGLHLITMGIVMVIAVGAPANHRAILADQQHIGIRQDELEARLDQIEAKLDGIGDILSRLLKADRDEVSDQRDTHH